MTKPRMRVIVINEETGDEILNEVGEVRYDMQNHLTDAPYSIAIGYKPIAKYSTGWSIHLSGFFPNKNMAKEMKEALKENGLG